VPFYPAADRDVQPVPAPVAGMVACRCCPGGISRSTRARRYSSDMSEAEWAICEPLLPGPAWLAGRGGRPASWCMRDIVDAIRYLTHNGPVWRALPADFPPAGTVYWWADKWQADGSAERMYEDLRDRVRVAAGRTSAPTAAIIDSQSVKGSEMIGRVRRGYDAGKKVNGQAAPRRRCPGPAAHGAGHRRVRAGPRRRQAAAVEPAAGPSRRSSWPGPTAATPASSLPGPRPSSSRSSRCKSSGGPMTCTPGVRFEALKNSLGTQRQAPVFEFPLIAPVPRCAATCAECR
jgi:transposase